MGKPKLFYIWSKIVERYHFWEKFFHKIIREIYVSFWNRVSLGGAAIFVCCTGTLINLLVSTHPWSSNLKHTTLGCWLKGTTRIVLADIGGLKDWKTGVIVSWLPLKTCKMLSQQSMRWWEDKALLITCQLVVINTPGAGVPAPAGKLGYHTLRRTYRAILNSFLLRERAQTT